MNIGVDACCWANKRGFGRFTRELLQVPELYPHETFPNKKLMYFWKLKRSLALRQADLILTVSEHSKREILKLCKIPESNVAVISEGFNYAFTCLPKNAEIVHIFGRYHLNPSDRFLLHMGGISPYENLAVPTRS